VIKAHRATELSRHDPRRQYTAEQKHHLHQIIAIEHPLGLGRSTNSVVILLNIVESFTLSTNAGTV